MGIHNIRKAELDPSGRTPAHQLGSGTSDTGGQFLRDDRVWAPAYGGNKWAIFNRWDEFDVNSGVNTGIEFALDGGIGSTVLASLRTNDPATFGVGEYVSGPFNGFQGLDIKKTGVYLMHFNLHFDITVPTDPSPWLLTGIEQVGGNAFAANPGDPVNYQFAPTELQFWNTGDAQEPSTKTVSWEKIYTIEDPPDLTTHPFMLFAFQETGFDDATVVASMFAMQIDPVPMGYAPPE